MIETRFIPICINYQKLNRMLRKFLHLNIFFIYSKDIHLFWVHLFFLCLKCLYYMLYLINTTLMCRKLLEVVFIFSMEFSNSCGFPSLCKYLLNRDHPATTLICIWLNLLLIYVSLDYRNLGFANFSWQESGH